MSSNAPVEAETDKEAGQGEDDSKSGLVDESAPQSPVDNEQQALPPKTPPQPFNFESITRDMVGMKITQAASMDTRLGGLEARMARLERVIDQLCHAVPGIKTPLSETPLRGPTSDPASFSFAFATNATPPTIPASYKSVAPDLGISHSTPSTPDDDSLNQPRFHASNNNRPTSTVTIRGATSLPTLSREVDSNTTDDYAAALLSQVETERAARRNLEAQVAKLSQRLNTLSATMYAMVRSDSGLAKARSQEQLLQPPTPGQSPAQGKSIPVPVPVPQKQATLSAFHAQQEGEEEDDDRATEEEFLTPGEERSTLGGYGFGVFGEPARVVEEEMEEEEEEADLTENEREETEDESKRKKAMRTLSLSQLTLGRKGGQAVQI
jgi:hypothetical protein